MFPYERWKPSVYILKQGKPKIINEQKKADDYPMGRENPQVPTFPDIKEEWDTSTKSE